MLKKQISVILSVIIAAAMIAACNNNANTETEQSLNETISEITENESSVNNNVSEISLTSQSSDVQISSDVSGNSQISLASQTSQVSQTSQGSQNSSDTSKQSSSNSSQTSSGTQRTTTTTTTTTVNDNSQPSSSHNGDPEVTQTSQTETSTSPSSPQISSKPSVSSSQQQSKPQSSQASSKPAQTSQQSQVSQSSQPPQPSQPAVNNASVGDINLFNSLFNISSRVTIQIYVSQDEMNKLQNDYYKYKNINSKSPIYRKASIIVSVNGQSFTMDEVGIRLKGNMSLTPVYDKHGNLNLTHYKLSFNETFDDKDYYGSEAKVWEDKQQRKARKNRRFATLKKLDLKWNALYDETYIREIYAAEMFKQQGVLAQNIGLTQVILNGNNYGVMKLYEPVDELFLEKRLPQQALGGDLYKCGWTMSPCNYVMNQVTYGVDDKDKGTKFNYNLKTNEKSSNHAALKNLLSVLSSNPDKAAYESVIDTGYLANFLAASYFAADPDDIRNNYNNHYVYFRADNGKAIFIPYDNDRTLGVTYGYNPDGTGMTKPSPYSDMASGIRKKQANPMINLGIVKSDGYIRNEYTNALKNIANSGMLNPDNFNAWYETARANYEIVITPSIGFANQKQQFRFSLDGRYTSGDNSNMSFSVFSERILKTYNSEVK